MAEQRRLEFPKHMDDLRAAAHNAVCDLWKLKTREEFDAALHTTWKAYCAFHQPVMMPAGQVSEREMTIAQHNVQNMLVQAACALAHHQDAKHATQ